jgi:transposase-like protein
LLEDTVLTLKNPALVDDPLTEILREGARKLLAQAIEAEVEGFLAQHRDLREEGGQARVVRNGYLPEREIQTGIGMVSVKAPRVHDRHKGEEKLRFNSRILPRYLRRSQSLEELIPWLYLKGVSTGDFQEALSALLGGNAPGLSASTISRLKGVWTQEFDAWQKRDLSGRRYVYLWVDGVYFNVRMDESKHCVLVVIGATEDGKKELLAIADGYRESEASWKEVLFDLRVRGLTVAPKLAIGDGALGFWKALPQVYGSTKPQRCWVHKTANVLNALPKSQQPRAKSALQDIWMAAGKEDAEKAFDLFLENYQDKYPKAADCLRKDRDALLTFYDFPARHWQHIRTTNPIESTFATVRLRTAKTRNNLSRESMLSLVFKLAQGAERRWLKLKGSELLRDVIQDVRFVDGIREDKLAA